MNIGVVGLGKMGLQIAKKLSQAGFTVIGYDPSISAELAHPIALTLSLAALAQQAEIIWLMVPAGSIVDTCINEMLPHMQPDSIVVDGGNSFYKDSIKRAQFLATKEMHFLDCGTSGGTHGLEHGFSLMVGGKLDIYNRVEPLLKTLAAPNGYGLMGEAGAGHFVKMV
ncbi:6-phosphogluconate dehydrogenase, partial [Candidatus Dependentiae bacterium]|nr:6-phosphogluconate dehydrogenase [Candidatus Dependentiae bacterium]